MRTGAFSLVETALQAGVAVFFGNPGTIELPIVAAFDRVPSMRVVPEVARPRDPGPRAGIFYARDYEHREGTGHHTGLAGVRCMPPAQHRKPCSASRGRHRPGANHGA
jgi:hypothetical protein